PYLNIGRRPFDPGEGDEDSLNISLVGDWRCLGFRVIDGFLPEEGESVAYYGDEDALLYMRTVDDGPVDYLGVVADSPIRRVSIVELPDDIDDIGYDDFRLAALARPSADFNLDGVVDGADFLYWQQGLGIVGSALRRDGDANGDANVDSADLGVW